jgi:hypothetical protein
MGQIFYACAYDIEKMTCCVYDSDKFHANCYAHSGSVLAMHYLLRKKPYRIMWGGSYVDIYDVIDDSTREEDLFGLSTYRDLDNFDISDMDLQDNPSYDKVKFIGEKNKKWKLFNVWDKARRFFNWDKTHSTDYSGYLLNHTKRLAIDLNDYHEKSKGLLDSGECMAIDAIPPLTETGGGTDMALDEGVSADSTENLAGAWCGDMLQIVNELPQGFSLINCCFANSKYRVRYCYRTFGVDENSILIGDLSGKLYQAAGLNLFGKRGELCHIRVEVNAKKIRFIPVYGGSNE